MATHAKDDSKPATIIVRKMPVVIRKVVHNKLVREGNVQDLMYKDEIIYQGNGDFLKEKPNKIVLLNRFHRLKHFSRTIVKCYKDNVVVEKTSDNIVNLIGQSNYDTVFSALCSVISQDLRIKGILSLLTTFKDTNLKDGASKYGINISCQTDLKFNQHIKNYADASTQTQKYYMLDWKRARTKRKHLMPYIVKDTEAEQSVIKKVVINPFHQEQHRTVQVIRTPDCTQETEANVEFEGNFEPDLVNMPDVKEEIDIDEYGTEYEQSESDIQIQQSINMNETLVHEENSNESIGNISLFSVTTNNSVFNDLSIISNVDKHIETANEPGFALNMGHCVIKLRTKPEDNFHLATEENLEYLTPVEKKNLLLYQACIDFKNCLNRDEDGNMPFHIAVMNNDVELLKRHCAMLKIKKYSVDIPAAKDYTALKMAVLKDSPACAGVLLRMGADPLQVDDSHRSPLHYAAEESRGCVEALISYCRENARKILQENDDLWKPNYSAESDEMLSKYLLESMCSLCDDQGFTPLMLATQIGNYENAKLLVEACPGVVNKKMPTSGNTALYLTIAAARSDAVDNGNKTKLSNKYQMTIELLLENGADPSIENHSGGTVELLLVELNILDLSVLIAKKMTSLRFFEGKTTENNFDSIMLVKNEAGDVDIMNLSSDKAKKSIDNKKCIHSPPDKKLFTPHKNAAIKKVNKRKPSVTNSYKTIREDDIKSVKDNTTSNGTKKKANKIQIIDNIPVNTESIPIQNLPTSSGYLVLNTVSLDNTKTSPIKINSKEVKIINNSNNIYTIDKLNMKTPILNAATIQKSNNLQISDSDKKSVVQIRNTKTHSNLDNNIVGIDNFNMKIPISNATAIPKSNIIQISSLDKKSVVNINDIKTHSNLEGDLIVIDNLNMKIPISKNVKISGIDKKSIAQSSYTKTRPFLKSDIIVTDNLNLKIPISNSKTSPELKKPVVKIMNTKTNVDNKRVVVDVTDNTKKPVIVENQTTIKPIIDNRKPKFFDTFKNFIQNDIVNNEVNERKRKHDVVVVKDSAKMRKE